MGRREQLKERAVCGLRLRPEPREPATKTSLAMLQQSTPQPACRSATTAAALPPQPRRLRGLLHNWSRACLKAQQQPQPQQQHLCQQLQGAAGAGDVHEVKRLVTSEPHLLDATGTDGFTALHHAAAHSQLGTAEALLLAGADANATDSVGGEAPLHLAASAGCPQLVRLLLNHGADAAATNCCGATALHTAAAAAAASVQSLDTLVCLARHGPHLLAARAGPGAFGDTPVHTLCRRLSQHPSTAAHSMLRALAAERVLSSPCLELQDEFGKTPLCLAAAAGSLEVVRQLLACGACPAVPTCRLCSRFMALDCDRHAVGPAEELPPGGAAWDSSETVRHNLLGHTCPLAAACCTPSYDIMLCLLAAGAGAAGLSPAVLDRAATDGRADAAAALMKAGLQSGGGARLLLTAVDRGDEGLLQALLGGGMDPNCPEDPAAAWHLLKAALLPGHETLLRMLLWLPGEPCEPSKGDGEGSQRTQHAQRRHCTATRLDVCSLACRLSISPASYALRHSSLSGLRLLLAAGCPAGPVGAEQPPLFAAAARLDAARCHALLEGGAHAGYTDERGQSALDAVLALCTDAQLIELTSYETRGASASTEGQLLRLVELLRGAGAPCARFLAEHGREAGGWQAEGLLVHRSLLLALGLPAWSRVSHHLWPAAFRCAARAALLALRGIRVRLASAGEGLHGRRAVRHVCLPDDVCCLIIANAALPVSSWVDDD